MGVLGVAGIGGDVGPNGELGEVVNSGGGGFLLELRFGLGGASTPSPTTVVVVVAVAASVFTLATCGFTPNSDIDKVTRAGSLKLFIASAILPDVGFVGEGGNDPSFFDPPTVAARRGG